MPARRLSREEIGQRGSRIYKKNLRAELESKFHGKFVAIDVESEAFAIADEASSAAEQLWEQNPEAQVFVKRVGYPAAFHLYRHVQVLDEPLIGTRLLRGHQLRARWLPVVKSR